MSDRSGARPRGASPRANVPRRAPANTGQPSGGKSQRLVSNWSPSVWFWQHREAGASAGKRLWKAPFSSLLTAMVLGIALALPGAFYVLLENLQHMSGAWDGSVRLSVFLKPTVADADAEALAADLTGRADVSEVRYLSKADSMAEFERLSGLGGVLSEMGENPLPAVLLVRPATGFEDPSSARALQDQFARLDLVDQVQLDLEWLDRLRQVTALGQRLAQGLGALLCLAVLLVVGNTIRLSIEDRRQEVRVLSMVGGSRSYIRRPLLYLGVYYGVAGGVFAWLLVSLAVAWLQGPVGRLASAYGSEYSLSGLSITDLAFLLGMSIFLGWFGAWVAVRRHLGLVEEN